MALAKSRRRVGQIISDGPIARGVNAKVAMQRARDLLAMVGLDAGRECWH
jgi:peptide/nickel transport system ATP-binding protein